VHVRDDGLVEYYPAIAGLPPGPPTLSATSSGNTVSVSWTPDPSGGVASSYTLYAGSAPGLRNLATIPVRGATSFTAVAPTGLYYLTVEARNGYGTSALSNEVAVQAGCVAPPPAPGPLGYTKFGGAVRLAWSAAATATGYQLEAGYSPGVVDLGTIPLGNVTSFSASAPLGVYYVRVRAVNACGVGPASNEVAVALDGTMPLPDTPTGFTATVAGRTVAFQFVPASSGGLSASFQLEAGVTPGGTIATLPTAATTLVVPNAPPGTFYVRVRAVNPAGVSAPTSDLTVVIP
jgi:predicted phage tail protein